MTAMVTVCIPAFQAESFIDRTLKCARDQSYRNLRILISVDYCADETVEICRHHAREDRRVDVVAQKENLGWSQNANAAIEKVDSEFFFLYFHDDIIEPTYVEKLLIALNDHPDAATAHCDLAEFGQVEFVRPAHAYPGSAFSRLVEFLLSPEKGTTLRSLTRTDAVSGNLSFPQITGNNAWTAYPFHLKQLSAGPAVAVDEVLYRRWQRKGSLTKSTKWTSANMDIVVESQRQSAKVCLEIARCAVSTESEFRIFQYCLYLFMLRFTRQQELRLGTDQLICRKEICKWLKVERRPLGMETLSIDQQKWLANLEADIFFLEGKFLWRTERFGDAIKSLEDACSISPHRMRSRILQTDVTDPSSERDPMIAALHQILSKQEDEFGSGKLNQNTNLSISA